MERRNPNYYQDVEKCVADVIERVGKKIVLGIALGIGKPNHVVNEFFKRAKQDPKIHLTICTALSLERPTWSNDLERRFLEPFVERVFGGYVDLEYMLAIRNKKLPPNVDIKEMYLKAGSALNIPHIQQNYISSNYSHIARDILDNCCNVVGQIFRKGTIGGRTVYSASSNSDVVPDVIKAMRRQEEQGRKIAVICQVNQNLPFMYGDALLEPENFTEILENPEYNFRLFSAPKMAVTLPDFMIGVYVSTLIKDRGTLQIGIGTLGDAMCYGIQLRHEHNDDYKEIIQSSKVLDKFGDTINKLGELTPFDVGLTGSTEMLVDGYLHLWKSGIIKRKTYNNVPIQRLINQGKIGENVSIKTIEALIEEKAINPRINIDDFYFLKNYGILKEESRYEDGYILTGDIRIPADFTDKQTLDQINQHCLGTTLKNGILIHAGFFLGPESFYKSLNDMDEEERKKINMTSILNVNELYGNEYASQELKELQRTNARFVNAGMMVTLSGAVVSDGLENGQVVSGVGGQYNFVAQAHSLPGARVIIMCRATREKKNDVQSNIVWNYGHTTISRHLRDIVVTEYGIAELRGKSDKEIIMALLNITDSRFQDTLLQKAKDAKKIPYEYQIPEQFRNNLPERLKQELSQFKKRGFFPTFPYGTDLTNEELAIGKALNGLKGKMSSGIIGKASVISKALTIMSVPQQAKTYLERLKLDAPSSFKEKMMQKIVIHALISSGLV